MTDHRTEAVQAALVCVRAEVHALYDDGPTSRLTSHDEAARVLAAADAADREQGIVRVKLDEELADRIAQASHDAECDCGEAVADTEPVKEAVLAALREAAQ